MTSPDHPEEPRSYGCSYGCGNPYDVIIVMVADGTTEFLCMPCFIKLAGDTLAAITDSDDENVKAAMTWAASNPVDITPGPRGKSRGHNAPATNTDPDLIDAFEDVITVDELPEAFR